MDTNGSARRLLDLQREYVAAAAAREWAGQGITDEPRTDESIAADYAAELARFVQSAVADRPVR